MITLKAKFNKSHVSAENIFWPWLGRVRLGLVWFLWEEKDCQPPSRAWRRDVLRAHNKAWGFIRLVLVTRHVSEEAKAIFKNERHPPKPHMRIVCSRQLPDDMLYNLRLGRLERFFRDACCSLVMQPPFRISFASKTGTNGTGGWGGVSVISFGPLHAFSCDRCEWNVIVKGRYLCVWNRVAILCPILLFSDEFSWAFYLGRDFSRPSARGRYATCFQFPAFLHWSKIE